MAEVPLRVLIVDDEAPARRRLRELLDDCASALPLAVVGEAQAQRVIDLLSPEIQREVQQRLEQNPVLQPMTQKMVSQSLKKRLAGMTSGVS